MRPILPVLLKDGYKVGHKFQYPPDTTLVYSNWTPRTTRVPGATGVVNFGVQYFVQEYLIYQFRDYFFEWTLDEVLADYQRRITHYLGPLPSYDHIAALHDLGYLPLRIKAIPEGTLVPLRVPLLTIVNTKPEFFWLTNMLETLMSNVLWLPVTSATTAFHYRLAFERAAQATGADPAFCKWQGHDFSMRGLPGIEAACLSGAAHLLSFTGTDTIPAIDFLEQYYQANCERELIGGSVPATEHSVMSVAGATAVEEFDQFRRLITEVYPTGIVSLVSDTWDFWQVLTDYLPRLKAAILARDGKVVIRPDSGDPVKIICGDPNAVNADEWRGAIQVLWNIFGGTVTPEGYKVLDPHIGLIYGDSITPDRQGEILYRLQAQGFASSNVVLGIGSYCVSPETPILCSDLVWRSAGSLVEGQEIIAFDENPTFGDGRHAARRYRTARIEANAPAEKGCYRIVTDLGDPITASDDHPWLVWVTNRSPANMRLKATKARTLPRTAGLAWKTSAELRPGDQIAFFGKPWRQEESRSAGWLAGMFDGEGCLARSTMREVRIQAWKVNISQNAGPLMDRIRTELVDRGYTFYENKRTCGQLVLTGGWSDVIRFLGEIAPYRLRTKLPTLLADMPALISGRTYTLATVQATTNVGPREVASIRTSTGTFITGGYLSHNTYQFVTRDTYGLAMKATYAERADGSCVDIYKHPKTDDGTKRSACGLLAVEETPAGLLLREHCAWDQERTGLLQTVFENGEAQHRESLATIRGRIDAQVASARAVADAVEVTE